MFTLSVYAKEKFLQNQAEFEDIKGAIRIRKSKKNRQHNGQKKKDKQRFPRDFPLFVIIYSSIPLVNATSLYKIIWISFPI